MQMTRVILMWMCLMSTASAQWTYSNMLSGVAGLSGQEGGFWGRLTYPATMDKAFVAAGIFAEKRFMTDLGYYDLGCLGNISGQLFQIRFVRAGNASMSNNTASVALSRKISEDLVLAVKLGYVFSSAKGYGSIGQPLAGIGALFKLSSKLKWALQADGINSFFASGSNDFFLLRMGMGYLVSDLALISLEMVKEKGYPVHTTAGLGYAFGEHMYARIGYAFQLATFTSAVGFRYAGLDLELASSYHLSLGPTAGLSLSYQFKQAE
jgi:hypothetical protein